MSDAANATNMPSSVAARPDDLPAVPMNLSPRNKFREFLGVKGLKCTEERLTIVDHVFEKHTHFEADELVASLKQRKLNVSRSTVYRTLSLMVEAGLLRDLPFGASTVYEHDYGYPHHEHLKCDKCGEVIEFVCDDLTDLQEEICRRFRFRATTHRFVIHGVCEKCNRASMQRRRVDLI